MEPEAKLPAVLSPAVTGIAAQFPPVVLQVASDARGFPGPPAAQRFIELPLVPRYVGTQTVHVTVGLRGKSRRARQGHSGRQREPNEPFRIPHFRSPLEGLTAALTCNSACRAAKVIDMKRNSR